MIQNANYKLLLGSWNHTRPNDIYLQGFYEGKMIIGDHSGKTVQDAKPLIKDTLVQAGDAVNYMEPEKTVISRYDFNVTTTIKF